MTSSGQGVGRPRGRPRTTGPQAAANPLNRLTHAERRELFLRTAARLFEAKGYTNASVTDITRELGFSKAIFYYYWDSKEEVLEEIHERAITLLNEKLDRIENRTDPQQSRLDAAVGAYLDCVVDNRVVIAVLMRDYAYSRKMSQKRRAYINRFQRLVEEEIAAGAVRDLDPQMLTFAILGLCSSIVQWYEPGGRFGPEEIKALFVGLASHGYVAHPKDVADTLISNDPEGRTGS